MNLSELAGNPRIRDQLAQRGSDLSHAYILSGPEGSGRHTLARIMAMAMMCRSPREEMRPCGECIACRKVKNGIHPDVITVSGITKDGESGAKDKDSKKKDKEKSRKTGKGADSARDPKKAGEAEDAGPKAKPKAANMDQIREMRADAYVQPNEGTRKIYILECADDLNNYCQNALLKILEDGPPFATFLLIAQQSGRLLETVRSRCEELALIPVPPAECLNWLSRNFPNAQSASLQQAANECRGILGQAVAILKGWDQVRGEFRAAARKLADCLETGQELAFFETVNDIDEKEDVPVILDLLEAELSDRLPRSNRQKRLIHAVGVIRDLRSRLVYNPNVGILTSSLCAGVFSDGA